MSFVLATACASFLFGPAHVSPMLRTSHFQAPHLARTAPPIAFDGSLDDLTMGELQGLLKHRGLEVDDTLAKKELIARLAESTPQQSKLGDPTMHPSEAHRVDVFERVSPAVAFIQTSFEVPRPLSRSGEHPAGAGSGFVWDTEGHIVTNYHVVAGEGPAMPGRLRQLPRKVRVSLQGSAEQVEATVVGFERDKDLAVLKVDPEALRLKPLTVASSSDLRVGQNVLAIGNPFGLDYTLTQGIVSALNRDVDGFGGRPIRDCIQTDASINPGNSGGPLLDSSGRLIGVNTMIYSPNGVGANVGIGFAIPSDTVRRVVNQIITFGQNARPSLGATLLDDRSRKRLAASLRRDLTGALLTEVVPGSPADSLNLAPCERRYGGVLLGDLITHVNGMPIKQNEDLLCALEESDPEEPVSITVMRGCDPKKNEELHITLVRRQALIDQTR